MAVTESGHLASREVDDLYRRYGGDVYRYAYAVLGNHADAEDITQTTFLNAYRSIEQGVRPRKPSNWLLTIASNAIKQRFRHDQARPRQVELDDRIADSEVEDDGPSVGELLTALAKIPPQQRQAIVLRGFEGRSYAEIAGILGVTTYALETLLFRARRSLAEELEQQLTCTEAQFAISQSVDGRLGRKERRRLRDHLAECPDCASFARLQKGHRSALRGLLLVPIPVSLTLLKSLQSPGTASAATVPATATGVGAVSAGIGGLGATAASSGGLLAGGVVLKAAAVVAAIGVTGGAVAIGAKVEGVGGHGKAKRVATAPGKRLGHVAPRGVLVAGNGVARGKADAPGQARRAVVHASHASHTGKRTHVATSGSNAVGAHARAHRKKIHVATPAATKPASRPMHPTPKKPAAKATPTSAPKAPTTPPTTTPAQPTATAPTTGTASTGADPATHADDGNHNGADNGNVNGNGNANGNDKGK